MEHGTQQRNARPEFGGQVWLVQTCNRYGPQTYPAVMLSAVAAARSRPPTISCTASVHPNHQPCFPLCLAYCLNVVRHDDPPPFYSSPPSNPLLRPPRLPFPSVPRASFLALASCDSQRPCALKLVVLVLSSSPSHVVRLPHDRGRAHQLHHCLLRRDWRWQGHHGMYSPAFPHSTHTHLPNHRHRHPCASPCASPPSASCMVSRVATNSTTSGPGRGGAGGGSATPRDGALFPNEAAQWRYCQVALVQAGWAPRLRRRPSHLFLLLQRQHLLIPCRCYVCCGCAAVPIETGTKELRERWPFFGGWPPSSFLSRSRYMNNNAAKAAAARRRHYTARHNTVRQA